MGSVTLGFYSRRSSDRPRGPISSIVSVLTTGLTGLAFSVGFSVVSIGLSAGDTFAQGQGIVPAIPELSPSISEAEALFKLASRLEAGDAVLARDDDMAVPYLVEKRPGPVHPLRSGSAEFGQHSGDGGDLRHRTQGLDRRPVCFG